MDQKIPSSTRHIVHHDIRCSECSMFPIVGVRYKSIPKDNYNLCMECESKIFQENDHFQSNYYPMVKITHPSHHPKQLTYTVNDCTTYNHHNEEFKSIHLKSSGDNLVGLISDGMSKLSTTESPVEHSEASHAKTEETLFESTKANFLQQGVVDGKPVAGLTFPRAPNTGDPKAKPVAHTWSPLDHRVFQVRIGPDYSRHKKKAPSAVPLYDIVGVDVFRTKARMDHIARDFHLPDVSRIQTHHSSVPPLFIIQLQIPSEPPPSFFSTTEDGPGWSIVMYYKITEDTCNQLKNLKTASPAVKLFAEWCDKAPSDSNWRGRFKVICQSTNLADIGVPSMIESYNGKPVLIRKTGTIFRGANYLEKDIHVHKFANMAKQSIYLLSSKCAKLYMQIGFVIEGRDNHELPETIFGCVGVNLPQDELTMEIFD